jgi:hypothetical protein
MLQARPADVIPLDTTEQARLWVLTVLARAAERLQAAPDEKLCEVLLRVTGSLRELEQAVGTTASR